MQPLIRVTDAVKKFGSLVVLDHFSMEVAKGEKVVLIGASGSGKSTLLRCLIGLEILDQGTLEIEGEVLKKKRVGDKLVDPSPKEIRRVCSKLGMVFQHFNLFPHMTVLQNVMVGPRHGKGIDKEEAEALAREYIEKVGLLDKIDARPPKLSGGQRQRVAIARALAMEPDIMLFDEVTSALDIELIGEVLEVMRELAEEGMTMIIVTHEMHFAEDVADRVVYMDEGRIVEEAPPKVMFSTPRKPETQRFLRSILER
jgi:polar amino acid transport system ATP-binding protein